MAGEDRVLAGGAKYIDFQTDPSRYRHWKLDVDGDVATLTMDVDENGGLFEGYQLKLNSYDLGVDIELADAVQRLRFEHPGSARSCCSGRARSGCSAPAPISACSAGATHAHKVNFCKFTNETRNGIEDASENSGQRTSASINGTAAGGGYELALATDHIMLVDDGAVGGGAAGSAAAGGAAGHRRADARRRQAQGAPRPRRLFLHHRGRHQGQARGRVAAGRRDRAELASWRRESPQRAREFAAASDAPRQRQGHRADAARPHHRRQRHPLRLCQRRDRPRGAHRHHHDQGAGRSRRPPTSTACIAQGAAFWPLQVARELDDAILHLRINELEIGDAGVQVARRSRQTCSAYDAFLDGQQGALAGREIRQYWKSVLKRIDVTSRTLVALVEPGSCFAGTLAELVFAADRSYMLIGQQQGDNRAPPTHRADRD